MKKTTAVAVLTFRELVRSRVLLVWALLALFLAGVAYLLTLLSYGEHEKIFLDLGFAGAHLAGFLMILLGLAAGYQTDYEQKGILLHLSKPIERREFLLGRILGFYAVTALSVCGMAGLLFFILWWITGDFLPLYFSALGGLLLEFFVVSALGLFFQTLATSMAACVLYTAFFIFLGHLISQLRWVMEKTGDALLRWVLLILQYLLPNLEAFNLKNRIWDPEGMPTAAQWGDLILYAITYSTFLYLLGWLALERREVA